MWRPSQFERNRNRQGSLREYRLCESQRGVDTEPTWYSVRVMKSADPRLAKGNFVKVTGKLKTDFYLSREGKPTGTLLVLAFEATKLARRAAVAETANGVETEE